MAGTTIKKIPVNKDFKPDDTLDTNRTVAEKKAQWRQAEGEVYGKEFVKEQEKRIKEGKLMDEEIRDKLIESNNE